MHQDVAWARATADGIAKNYLRKRVDRGRAGELSHRRSDFSSALMKAGAAAPR